MIVYFGITVFHLWLLGVFLLYIGYITCADYYDYFNDNLLTNLKVLSVIVMMASGSTFLMLLVGNSNNKEKSTLLDIYQLSAFMGSLIIVLGAVVIFFSSSTNIRRWFGRKRGKY